MRVMAENYHLLRGELPMPDMLTRTFFLGVVCVDDRDFMQFPISLPNDGAIDVVIQEPVSIPPTRTKMLCRVFVFR